MGHTSYHRLTGKQTWIIDIGASHHMTGTYECLNGLRDIMPCLVGLPNGAETKALKEGTVTLGEKLKLRHVFFMPKLKCNLISYRNLRMLIEAGEQREGLYFLKEWLLFMLTRQLVFSSTNREVFFSSDNKAKECFDLIHCDLWGAYRVPASCGDDEDPYMQNDMEKQQTSVSDVEHEIDVEMGHNMEMATDGNTKVGDRGGTDVSRPMVSEEQFGKGKRVKQPSVRLKDYVTHTIRVSPSTSSSF
ncbi:hypothetical protein AAG906_035766 [Vitis piasezkii]